MSSHNSLVSGLDPDPHISASGFHYSNLASKDRARVPERDNFAFRTGPMLRVLLVSKPEHKDKGFYESEVGSSRSLFIRPTTMFI